MSAPSSPSTSNVLSRYRPVLLFAAGLAAAYGVYIFQGQLFSLTSSTGSRTSLRRSNAIHRGHRRPRRGGSAQPAQRDEANYSSGTGERDHNGDDTSETEQLEESWEIMSFGTYSLTDGHGQQREIPLRLSTLPTRDQLMTEYGFDATQAQLHYEMIEIQYLMCIAATQPINLSANISVEAQVELLRQLLIRRGIREHLINQAFRAFALAVTSGRHTSDASAGQENDMGWRREPDRTTRGGQSLLNLLYHIAEDQARREGYVHRGVTCNSCGSMPIRGIRYRCANCTDFDLCETCETMQVHPKTHLFYKVRIPAPFLANPKQAQPVWYPGRPAGLPHSLPKSLSLRLVKETGYENAEVDAMWDQFKCLAATEWRDDPNELRMAIDRKTFDKCFCPTNASRIRPPQLIYDRIFAFYDVNGDGLIGFEEFTKGLASLNNKNKDERLKRIYQGYDIDGDGYIDRRDFLRMFRAYYALTKELTEEMILGMEDNDMEEVNAREIILGSQPISSIFATSIPPPMTSRFGEGKQRTAEGDLEIVDGGGVVRESGDNTMDRREVIAEAAERAAASSSSEVLYQRPWHSSGDTEAEAMELLEEALGGGSSRGALQHFNSREDSGDDSSVDETEQEQANKDDAEEEGRDDQCNGDSVWPPDWVTPDDIKAAFGRGGLAAADIQSTDDRKKVMAAAKKRLEEEERRTRERIRRLAWEERWRRRRFYVDEEEGAVAPEGYQEENIVDFSQVLDGETIDTGSPGSTSASGSRPPSPRSRSSSKVRFRDYLTEAMYETRSNPSTSSRSIPYGERWGGYEIPEAEKDIGREILYQVTQQGLNELLDPLFREKEDLALEVFATRDERTRWRHCFASSEGDEQKTSNEPDRKHTTSEFANPVVPMDEPVSEFNALLAPENAAPLPIFGRESGVLPAEDGADTASSGSSAPPLDPSFLENLQIPMQDDQQAEAAVVTSNSEPDTPPNGSDHPAAAAPSSSSQYTAAVLGHDFDPTLPQFRPNTAASPPPLSAETPTNKPAITAAPLAVPSSSSTPQPQPESEETQPPSAPSPSISRHPPEESPSQEPAAKPPSSAQTPSPARLERLRFLNGFEHEIKARGGPGRLDYQEFYNLMNSDKGRRLGFLASWIEMASF